MSFSVTNNLSDHTISNSKGVTLILIDSRYYFVLFKLSNSHTPNKRLELLTNSSNMDDDKNFQTIFRRSIRSLYYPVRKPQFVDDLIIVGFENLPDYSTGDYTSDLALLEHVLISNKFHPCYIDLTRKDIGLSVVKAVIPGMEIIGDFEEFSRVHPELFQNYLKLNSKLSSV